MICASPSDFNSEQNYEIGPLLPKKLIVKIKVAYFFATRCRYVMGLIAWTDTRCVCPL